VTAEARPLRRSRIKSSNGHYQQRFVVPALIRIGAIERVIEVSLVSRGEMVYRMLLGRDALAGFLIDPSAQDLLGGPRRDELSPPSARAED
jgi:ribosomal protein S6--L-glutamate ligase